MISVDEMALVKQRLDGFKLPPSAAGSLRQLELLFLVAHDEVIRMEKFESRARLVADKWELVRSAKIIAAQSVANKTSHAAEIIPSLPDGIIVLPDDVVRCSAALDFLFGPASDGGARSASSTVINTPEKRQLAQQQQQKSDQLTPPAAITAHPRRRPANPAVYVDDEFSYDDDAAALASHNNNSGFPTPSQSPQRGSSVQQQQQAGGSRSGSGAMTVPSNDASSIIAPASHKNSNNNNNNNAEADFIDRLACCKFISALPLAVFQLAFHREGDYAGVALAAALDELKLFEAQLRSSQESFVNLRACWNHELRLLSQRSGAADLFEAAHIAAPPQEQEQVDVTARTTNRSGPARLDRLAAAETADGGSWQAPPLIPLRPSFTVDSELLFAGYCGPTLLGPVVGRSTLRHELTSMATRQLEMDEDTARARLERLAAFTFAEAMADRAVRGEALWGDAMYAKSTAELRVLEMREELRRLKSELLAGKEERSRAAAAVAAASSASQSPEKPASVVVVDVAVASN